MTDYAPRSATSTAIIGTWGSWFGEFKTAAAAKRYLTMQFIGPKVTDRDCWTAWEIRQVSDWWEVRVAYAPPTPSNLFKETS